MFENIELSLYLSMLENRLALTFAPIPASSFIRYNPDSLYFLDFISTDSSEAYLLFYEKLSSIIYKI